MDEGAEVGEQEVELRESETGQVDMKSSAICLQSLAPAEVLGLLAEEQQEEQKQE